MTIKKKDIMGFILSLIVLVLLLLSSISAVVTAAPSRLVQKGNTTEKIVALTFDDGSDGTNIDSILAVLSKHNVKATFFLTGSSSLNHQQKISLVK